MQVYVQIQIYFNHCIEQKQTNKAHSSKMVISIVQQQQQKKFRSPSRPT